VADVIEVTHLLHGKERHVFGDTGYTSTQQWAPKRGRKSWIAAKRSIVKAMADHELREITEQLERAKASIRVAVKHPLRMLKRLFGYGKVRYKGLAKDGAQSVVATEIGSHLCSAPASPTTLRRMPISAWE